MADEKRDDGGPAFPHPNPAYDGNWDQKRTIGGMSLRDWFAGQALMGILSGPASRDGVSCKEWLDAPQHAYKLADEMLKARAQ